MKSNNKVRGYKVQILVDDKLHADIVIKATSVVEAYSLAIQTVDKSIAAERISIILGN